MASLREEDDGISCEWNILCAERRTRRKWKKKEKNEIERV